MKKILSILATAIFFIGCNSDENTVKETQEIQETQQDQASYKVEITFNWTKENFPTNFPSNDHFSPVIGWVHNAEATLFQENTIASAGIKQMAETGGTSILKNEFNDKITSGEGLNIISGSGLGSGKGSIIIERIDVTKTHSLVSLSTMIAPSPDWYVAIVKTNLYQEDGFADQLTINAYAYDAGTDSGTDYTSVNSATTPQEKITKIISSPFDTGKTIASVTFTKL